MFCKLEKDDKTFNHFLFLLQHINYCSIEKIDNEIQKQEIAKHCQKNSNKKNNEYNEYNWCKQNAIPMRIYLNTLKMLYFFYSVSNETNMSFELFESNVDKFNNNISFIESIYS